MLYHLDKYCCEKSKCSVWLKCVHLHFRHTELFLLVLWILNIVLSLKNNDVPNFRDMQENYNFTTFCNKKSPNLQIWVFLQIKNDDSLEWKNNGECITCTHYAQET